MSTTEVGNYGEDLSCRYISSKNYIILKRNFKKKSGEIDIIAIKRDVLVFIEVKSRYSTYLCSPKEYVTSFKQKTIKTIAKYFIHINNLYDYYVRFDVIEVFLNKDDDRYKINHLKDAFR